MNNLVVFSVQMLSSGRHLPFNLLLYVPPWRVLVVWLVLTLISSIDPCSISEGNVIGSYYWVILVFGTFYGVEHLTTPVPGLGIYGAGVKVIQWISFIPLPSPFVSIINSSPHGQNSRYFADDIFRCIFVNEKFCIWIKITLNFVPKGPFDNNQALV